MEKENAIIDNKNKTELLVEYLESSINDELILNSFIRNIKIFDSSSNIVKILVDSQDIRNILNSKYKKYFLEGIEKIFEKPLNVNFFLKNELENIDFNDKKENKNNHLFKKFLFDNYVTSNFNQEVVQIAKTLVKKIGKFSPFFITAKSGLGKTHLLHAIGNDFYKNNKKAIYIEPNKFTRDVYKFSKIKKNNIENPLNNFIDSMKKYDVLLFDDIQNLGDRQITLKILFEMINNHIKDNKQIVIVSDKFPQELSGFEERFITRFLSGISSKIEEPGIEDLLKIIEYKLSIENLHPEKWDREALNFIAYNYSNSIRSIEGAIKKIVFFSLNNDKFKYTYDFISSLFKNLKINIKEITPNMIINKVSSYYKIDKNKIISKSKKRELIIPRYICIWLIKKFNNLSFVEIGKIFGNRDHSTIISAKRRIDNDIKKNNTIKMALQKIENNIKIIK